MALKYLLKCDGVGLPHIFVFGNDNGAYVAAGLVSDFGQNSHNLTSSYPIDGVVFGHMNHSEITEKSILEWYVCF